MYLLTEVYEYKIFNIFLYSHLVWCVPNCLTEMFEVFKSTAKIDGESDDEEHFKYLLL